MAEIPQYNPDAPEIVAAQQAATVENRYRDASANYQQTQTELSQARATDRALPESGHWQDRLDANKANAAAKKELKQAEKAFNRLGKLTLRERFQKAAHGVKEFFSNSKVELTEAAADAKYNLEMLPVTIAEKAHDIAQTTTEQGQRLLDSANQKLTEMAVNRLDSRQERQGTKILAQENKAQAIQDRLDKLNGEKLANQQKIDQLTEAIQVFMSVRQNMSAETYAQAVQPLGAELRQLRSQDESLSTKIESQQDKYESRQDKITGLTERQNATKLKLETQKSKNQSLLDFLSPAPVAAEVTPPAPAPAESEPEPVTSPSPVSPVPAMA